MTLTADPASSRAEVRRLFDGAETSRLALVAVAAAVVAGVLHIVAAPAQLAEHVGLGLLSVVIGSLQILWGIWFLRRPGLAAFVTGLALLVGSIALWLVSILVRAPFSSSVETPGPLAFAIALFQLVGVVCLVILPFVRARSGSTGSSRAFPLVALVLLLGLALGGAVFGVGLAGEALAPALSDGSGSSLSAASEPGVSASAAPAVGASASSNATANQSAPKKDPNMPSDPSACMSGMDMPGCSSAQADAYFAKEAANAPPPDKTLAPITVDLTQDGSAQTGKFSVENGTMHLLVTVKLLSRNSGPYLVQGPGGNGDLKVDFFAPGAKTAAFSIVMKGSGGSAGLGAAVPLDMTTTGESPMPPLGDWTLQVGGQGMGAEVKITLTERFVM